MLDGSLTSRNEYIKNSNELNKGVNLNTYLEGNKQKVELDKRLDELSIKTGTIISGNLVRQNVINSSSSRITTISNSIDNENYIDPEEKRKQVHSDVIDFSVNRGKEIIEDMKNKDKLKGSLSNSGCNPN